MVRLTIILSLFISTVLVTLGLYGRLITNSLKNQYCMWQQNMIFCPIWYSQTPLPVCYRVFSTKKVMLFVQKELFGHLKIEGNDVILANIWPQGVRNAFDILVSFFLEIFEQKVTAFCSKKTKTNLTNPNENLCGALQNVWIFEIWPVDYLIFLSNPSKRKNRIGHSITYEAFIWYYHPWKNATFKKIGFQNHKLRCDYW